MTITVPAPGDPAIVVAGDALVDLTPARTESGGSAYEPHPGGSCLNVAVGLGRLGVPTAFLARVSTDAFGELLREHLAASEVRPEMLVETDDLTTLAAVHLRDGQASYSFHAAQAADRGLRPSELPALPEGAALHLGSIALVLEPTASTLEILLRQEAGRRVISLDPNIRPSLIPDRATYADRFARWLPLVDVLKVSAEDLAWLAPDRPADEAIDGWLAAGVGLVIITDGAVGARAVTSGASAVVTAPKVTVIDTVGAGDAFTSAALAHLSERGSLDAAALRALDETALRELLTTACRVAADTCTRAGAEPPWRKDLDRADRRGPVQIGLDLDDLDRRARALLTSGRRRILGITGPPGAGKSTLTRQLVERLGPELAVLVPMDGFHLANRTLLAWDRRARKGAADTFDAGGFVALLRRLRHQPEAGGEETVHAPDFDRDVEESIGSALPVRRGVQLVVTEGNYLLADGAWAGVRPLLDECWYVELDDHTRLDRLTLRHQAHGKSADDARAWASGTDQANAQLVAASRERADVIITVVAS